MFQQSIKALLFLVSLAFSANQVIAQSAPSSHDIKGYKGLHAAAHNGNLPKLEAILLSDADLEARDNYNRTPLHVAAYASNDKIVKRLAEAGANLNALEIQAYDIVTIAAVANDIELLDLALRLGAKPGNVTSPYDGSALIAASHRGNVEVVQRLIDAGAPLDHVNNLGWTALLEAVILGDGGPNHVAIVKALVKGGADQSIADSGGVTSLVHAQQRGYEAIIELLDATK